MKYILMMHGKKDAWDEYARWSKEDLERNVEFMQRFNKELRDSGVLINTAGLAWPQEARLVRAGDDGEPVTDGVFPEAKEFLAGYWVIDVECLSRPTKSLRVHRRRPGWTCARARAHRLDWRGVEARRRCTMHD